MKFERPEDQDGRPFDLYRYSYLEVHPSVGEILNPGEWKEGRDAILPEPNEFEEIDYSPEQRLGERFKKHGLQVIVKMASIELTPEKPHFPMGSWHVSCCLSPLGRLDDLY
jgi:hypothetical protein